MTIERRKDASPDRGLSRAVPLGIAFKPVAASSLRIATSLSILEGRMLG